MNDKAKIGRLSTALTMMVEVVDDIRQAEEPDLMAEAQAFQDKLKDRMKELRSPEDSVRRFSNGAGPS